jgi:hypothetical protein
MAKIKLLVQNMPITLARIDECDYISLTDIARVKNSAEPKYVGKNWLCSRTTIEYVGLWEKINNPNFKGVEFDALRAEAGLNSFTLSPNRWVELTAAIGIRSTASRPLGVAGYSIVPQLPQDYQADLPSPESIAERLEQWCADEN